MADFKNMAIEAEKGEQIRLHQGVGQ